MSYAAAVEVALEMKKVQFAKTLVGKQVSAEKLRALVAGGRTLLGALTAECGPDDSSDLHVDLSGMLEDAGVDHSQADGEGTTPLHSACANHNDTMVEYLVKRSDKREKDIAAVNNFGLTPLAALFWNFQVWEEKKIRPSNLNIDAFSPSISSRKSWVTAAIQRSAVAASSSAWRASWMLGRTQTPPSPARPSPT